MLGTIQSAEVLKYITGVGELLTDQLLTFDARSMDFRKMSIPKRDDCPVCGKQPTIKQLIEYKQVSCELKQQ